LLTQVALESIEALVPERAALRDPALECAALLEQLRKLPNFGAVPYVLAPLEEALVACVGKARFTGPVVCELRKPPTRATTCCAPLPRPCRGCADPLL
jgi:hypothetical protein